MNKKYLIAIGIILLLGLFIFDMTSKSQESEKLEDKNSQNSNEFDISKIVSGGPPKDGIPSIDDPKFVSMGEADNWIEDNELVLAIIYKGEKRVYPLQILVWHEIVNDFIAGDPIVITYCPLCGSGIAYERIINGEIVEFGTSGKLYNSNLIMYDRLTESYWTQIDGIAVTGQLTGTELKEISIDTVVWRDWKVTHSDSQVLSQETGFNRNYGNDPYGSYYENSFTLFPVENEDDSVHPKTVIFGIEIDGTYKAYKEEDVIALQPITDTVAEIKIKITRDESGIVKIIKVDSDEEIVKERDFWFAWYAFHPETQLYQA
ncbi:DUF3179 domain-containing protein [archaeon]|jgi:hypothetical protein|nr:DUF3179 domain-containing protein [archaeon]MBT6183047.1 DUF3179 domain-containing protein [archaeon]MBT6606373.1 DUF3179 domain-containing protein [archaeon]MBT7251458.1 DUF3179 domain-containing protein [archaeon]MBT7661244.1 DUF3179 domain-containing protein [archaeon]